MIFLALLVSFSDLKEVVDGDHVSLKGYISKGEEGTYISPLPQVKSCCLNKAEHLKIAGDIPEFSPYKVVTISGIYEKGAITPTRVE